MATSPFAWPYRHTPHVAYWGTANSQLNFCEEDYILTPYVAELINTLTNLIYGIIVLASFLLSIWVIGLIFSYAIYGISKNWGRNDAFLRAVPYLGIMTVGIGSMIFHATMKYYTQWCDDISMLIATIPVLHRVYTFEKSLKITVSSGIALLLLLVAFSTWHCVTDEIAGHNVLFGTMICLVGFQTRSIVKARVADPLVRSEVGRLVNRATIVFGTGYGIWIIDNIFCGFLTQTKRSIGMPWSFLLELHGWWHIFTGVGAYCLIDLVEYLTSEEAGQPLEGRFAWPAHLLINCSARKVGGNVKTAGVKGSSVVNGAVLNEKKSRLE